MQRIERYGVVVLLFMMVTFVAIALWDGGEEVNAGATGTDKVAARQAPAQSRAQRPHEADTRNRLPLSGQPRARSTVQPNAARPGNPAVGSRIAAQNNAPAANFPQAPRATTRKELRDAPDRRSEVRLEQPRWASEEQPVPNARQAERFESELRQARGERQPQKEQPRQQRNVVQRQRKAEPVARTIPAVQRGPSESPVGTYVVKSGDTLSGIAERVLGSTKRWREIHDLNPKVDPGRLFVGAKLLLPSATTAAVKTQQVAPKKRAVTPADGATYVVQAGDMLGTIAQRELGSAGLWRQIAELNPKVDPDRLLVGTKLRLPAGTPNRARDLVAKADPVTPRKNRKRVR